MRPIPQRTQIPIPAQSQIPSSILPLQVPQPVGSIGKPIFENTSQMVNGSLPINNFLMMLSQQKMTMGPMGSKSHLRYLTQTLIPLYFIILVLSVLVFLLKKDII